MDHTKRGLLRHTWASSKIEGLAAGVVSIEDSGRALEQRRERKRERESVCERKQGERKGAIERQSAEERRA